MPSKKKALKIYCTPEEEKYIAAQAGKAGLSVSRFMRNVCLGYTIRSRVNSQAVLALLQVNADLARLGGLLKITLNATPRNTLQLERLLADVESTRLELKAKAKELADAD